MSTIKNLSLLIVHKDSTQSSRLVSILDHNGFKIYARNVNSEEELNRRIKERRVDIIFAQQYGPLTPAQVADNSRRLHRDIPVIAIAETFSSVNLVTGVQSGADGTIVIDEDQHLVQVVNRELENRRHRSKYREINRKMYTHEARNLHLMQYASIPIAIVHEYSVLLVNNAFTELFEIEWDDDDILPIREILDPQSSKEYRELYQAFSADPKSFSQRVLKTTITLKSGELLPINIECYGISYFDKDCLQFSIEKPMLEELPIPDKRLPLQITKVSRAELSHQIELSISKAQIKGNDSYLFCIETEDFQELEETMGFALTEELRIALTDFILAQHTGQFLNVFSPKKTLLYIEGIQLQQAQATACELCENIKQHTLVCGDHHQQTSVSIGFSLITEVSVSATSVILQSIEASSQLRKKIAEGFDDCVHLYEPEKFETKNSLDINHLLTQAFKHNHLQLLFQPMMQFHGESSKNYEILLGIQPQYVDSYPDNFIALATRTNENDEIDRWVILESIKTLLKKTLCAGDEKIYIHLSKQSFRKQSFIRWVCAAIRKSKLDPSQIFFQIREIDASAYLADCAAFIKTMNQIGCSSVLTQCGSSSQYSKILDSAEFRLVKLEGTYIQNAQDGADLESILNILSLRDVKIIAPMVESASVMPILWKSKVDYIQGYYVQAPATKMDYTF